MCDTPTVTLSAPADGAAFSNVTSVDLSWAAADWNGGAGSCGGAGSYTVCIGSSSGACDLISTSTSGTSYTYSQSAAGTYYWNISPVNDCGATGTSSIRSFSITQPAKTCSVSLPASSGPNTSPVTVTLTGNANSTTGDTARLWVERATGAELSPNDIVPSAPLTPYNGIYYYQTSLTCTSTTSECSGSLAVTLPTAGDYIFHCDVPNPPSKCSGNPFCPVNGGSLAVGCTDWPSCGGTANARGGDNEAYCSEGGPYGVLTCPGGGNYTANYDCQTPVSACLECGPVPGSWTAWSACDASHQRTRTRTCTEDCGTDDCAAYPLSETETCYGQMTGTFFDASDLSDAAGCTGMAGAPKISGGTINLTGSTNYGPYTTDASGVYTTVGTVLSPDTYALTVNPGSGYVLSPRFNCQGTSLSLTGSDPSCLTQPCETAPTTTHDFGFWRNYGGWWQAQGGSAYGKTGMTSNIPGTVATPYLILQDANLQDGLAQIQSGSINIGTFPGAAISVSGWNATSGYGGGDQDYGYFLAKMNTFTKTAWDGASQPAYDGGTDNYEIYTHTGDVTMNWSPAAGQRVVYLIDGDVNVTGNIAVPTTSPTFLAVIASGIITFETNVTSVDGWWVGNILSFPCVDVSPADGSCDDTDSQFVGNGSFIGWGGINLGRDQGSTNNIQPAELFVFRPDLIINAPPVMSQSKYQWRRL